VLRYKGYVIKEFSRTALHASDVTFDMRRALDARAQPARSNRGKVTLVDAGDEDEDRRTADCACAAISTTSPFCFTYGDGLSDVDVSAVVAHHRSSGALATMTTVQRPGRFGAVRLDEQKSRLRPKKPKATGAWINGGYFVSHPACLRLHRNGDDTVWEREPAQRLAAGRSCRRRCIAAFWQPMDTLRDKTVLEESRAGRPAPLESPGPDAGRSGR